jgi:LysR family transcriptional regulator, glycine cleavage system transcriptional activator
VAMFSQLLAPLNCYFLPHAVSFLHNAAMPPEHDLPSTTALRCLLAAADTGSFTAAARAVHLTHGAVSRQVASLEAMLGMALFERRHLRLLLTPTGQAYVAQARTAVDLLRAAASQARRQASDTVVVSCEATLAIRWLVPRLGAFEALHPQLSVHVLAGGGPIDLAGNTADLAIRRSDHELQGDLVVQHLMDEWVGPVVSPRIKQAWSTLPRLVSETRPHAWADWQRLQPKLSKHPSKNTATAERRYGHFYLSLQAAAAGLGVGIGPYPMVMDDVQAGVLAAPQGFTSGGSRYLILATRQQSQRPAVQQVTAWLTEVALQAVPQT